MPIYYKILYMIKMSRYDQIARGPLKSLDGHWLKEEDNTEASWLVDRFVSELYLEALCKASWKCLSAVFRVSFNFH